MTVMTDNRYKIEVVSNDEFTGMRKGKFKELLLDLRQQVRNLPAGRSVRIHFSDERELKSFVGAARTALNAWKMNQYFIGKSIPEMAVYIGRK